MILRMSRLVTSRKQKLSAVSKWQLKGGSKVSPSAVMPFGSWIVGCLKKSGCLSLLNPSFSVNRCCLLEKIHYRHHSFIHSGYEWVSSMRFHHYGSDYCLDRQWGRSFQISQWYVSERILTLPGELNWYELQNLLGHNFHRYEMFLDINGTG